MDAEQWLILPEDVALAAGVFSGLLHDCTFLPTGPSWSLQPRVVLSCHEHLRSSSSPHILLRHCYDGTIEPDIMYSKVSVGNTVKTGLLFLPLFYFSKKSQCGSYRDPVKMLYPVTSLFGTLQMVFHFM